MRLPAPAPHIVLAKSPRPSAESSAARSNGETKKLLARCAWWCSIRWNFAPSFLGSTSKAAASASGIPVNFARTLTRSREIHGYSRSAGGGLRGGSKKTWRKVPPDRTPPGTSCEQFFRFAVRTRRAAFRRRSRRFREHDVGRSEEHTSELQS